VKGDSVVFTSNLNDAKEIMHRTKGSLFMSAEAQPVLRHNQRGNHLYSHLFLGHGWQPIGT